MSLSRVVVVVLLFGALVVLAIGMGFMSSPKDVAPRGKKVFGRDIAEELCLSRHGIYGVDMVRCESIGLRKLKCGFLTLGGMNELVIKGLSIVLPPADERNDVKSLSKRGIGSRSELNRLGLTEEVLSVNRIPCKFSKLSISGLAVAKLDTRTNVVPVLVAASADSCRAGLSLHECGIIVQTSTNLVGEAVLCADPDLTVKWTGGTLKL